MHIKKLQTLHNQAARFVTGCDSRTSTRKLMTKCNWLDIKEITLYFTMIEAWKLIWKQEPELLLSKIQIDHDNLTLHTDDPRLKTTRTSFRWRMIRNFNSLPPSLRGLGNLKTFKIRLRKYLVASSPRMGDG